MININEEGFLGSFDPTKATIGVVGHGYVGGAVDAFFRDTGFKVLVHDKEKPELQTLSEVVGQSEVIFVCVPTPMREDGSCCTDIVEGVICDVERAASAIGRDAKSFVVVVKSTVWPGFIESMKKKHPSMRICFSPEFLTEKSSVKDFKEQNRIIVGESARGRIISIDRSPPRELHRPQAHGGRR